MKTIQPEHEKFLLLLILLNIVPHYFDLPAWIFFSALTLWLWRALALVRKVYVPGPWVANLLGAFFSLGIYLEFGAFLGELATASVLVVMTVLKTFYLRSYRDLMALTFLCYFLLMAKLLNSQSISMSIFMLVDVILITSVLALYHSPMDKGSLRAVVKRSYSLALWALPAVGLLFFLFPRFQVGLLQRPQTPQGMTGFSEELKPGQISQLLRNETLVFRATFPNQSNLPTLDSLYWRGAVLSRGRGLHWSAQSLQLGTAPAPLPRDRWEEFIVQEIFMEPTQQRWLFPLDHPVQISQPTDDRRRRVTLRDDRPGLHLYRARQDLTAREYYLAFSAPQAPSFQEVPDRALMDYLEPYLDTSELRAPQALEWIEELGRLESPQSEDEWAELLFRHFQRAQFSYTLTPPKVDSVDEFLFETQQGFCEHYAASGASLLRLAGVPARVIVGFQGGTPSLLGDYLLVRYYDAHAWVEYWSSTSQSWQRWDPTAAVEPSRLSLGASASSDLFAGSRGWGLTGSGTWVGRVFGPEWARTYYQARLAWDQIESSWMRFLMRYDYGAQQDLFARWGFGRAGRLLMSIVSAVALVLLMLFVAWWLGRNKDPLPAELELYRNLNKKLLRKLKIEKGRAEGPLAFQRRLQGYLKPEVQRELEPFFKRFVEARYGFRAMSAEEVRSWRRRLKTLDLS